VQREHSANITEAPKAYPQQDPAKPMNVIVMDCRGLEFIEFKPEVGSSISMKTLNCLLNDYIANMW
jgi:hypothetical protein